MSQLWYAMLSDKKIEKWIETAYQKGELKQPIDMPYTEDTKTSYNNATKSDQICRKGIQNACPREKTCLLYTKFILFN